MLRFDGEPVLTGHWGVFPYLHLGPWTLPMYSLMVGLAFIAGATVYGFQGGGTRGGPSLAIITASLAGGILGSKAPYLLANVQSYLAGIRDPEMLFAGRTILGGFLGGILAVRLTKWRLGIHTRKGDALVPALGLGLGIGRVGCFFRGCCCGKVTNLPWGVDFGDGLDRHPTELYECAFGLLWFLFTVARPKGEKGALFDLFIGSYFTFRFFLEFIRIEPISIWGLTNFQLVCIPVVLWTAFKLFRSRPWITYP